MGKRTLPTPPPGMRYVFRPWRRDPRTGRKLYAANYGLKAWPILVEV